MIKKYLHKIAEIQARDDHREESFYPAVADLMVDFANSIRNKKISVTILPKKTEAGNPDFRIWDGNNKVVGYIEAKVPGTDLDKIEDSEQLQRYFETFPNVILTDFYEFRLYRNNKMLEKVSIGRHFIAKKLKTVPPVENQADIARLLEKFFDFSLPRQFTAEGLAVELAKRTRFLRDEIVSVELQNNSKKNYIRGFYNAFKKYLIAGLQETEFADLYSQTITYGMFAARTRAEKKFNRELAVKYIPQTIGILRDVFEFISLGQLPQQMEVIIDDIAEVLSTSDATKLLNDFYKQGKGSDPIIHFYETFLDKYDPSTREKRGVYYTPESVVQYIVNSVDEVLKNIFKKTGFADTSVKMLDPAAGTLTFLAEATKKAIQTFVDYFGGGDKNGFIKEHILKNFYGFELMMSPYTVAHLKMSYLLQEEGYIFTEDDRFQLYLTNTLNAKITDMPELPGLSSLAEEAGQANKIRKDTPILAIIGNPPYSIASYNKSEFETELMKHYKKDVTDERNIQILSDDYIKFIRYCHWKIEKSGSGIIGLITKNTYLNIAAAKGLRKQLLLTFDTIYILNLHGKLYEKTPDGRKDQNVFDIRVGTAIMFLVKKQTGEKTSYGKLFYKDLYGERDVKYDYLTKNNLFSTFGKEDELEIDKDFFFFEPKKYGDKKLYNKFWSIEEIFGVKNTGVETRKDYIVLHDNIEGIKSVVRNFNVLDLSALQSAYRTHDTRDWKLHKAKDDIQNHFNSDLFCEYTFKPFWKKYTFYTGTTRGFMGTPAKSVSLQFFKKNNIGMVLSKRYYDKEFTNCFVTENVTDRNFLGFQSYIFPLRLYKQNGDAFNGNGKHKNQVSNINPKIEALLENAYNKKGITEPIFYYIYAILHSNTYRTSFPELLKTNYPKIPFTGRWSDFQNLSDLGKELVDLHLLNSEKLNKPQVKFQGKGEGRIDRPTFIEKENVIKINDNQYFENINKKLWEYKIGKNQILKQWLRRKEKIEWKDAVEFCRIATAIYETFKTIKLIDTIYQEILNHLIEKNTDL